MNAIAFRAELLDAAAEPYRDAGVFARYFARGKLAGDPVFFALLRRRLIPDRARILDLGCGQGLLAAFLSAAERLHAQGRWHSDWPAPPAALEFRGIELMANDVARARKALGSRIEVQHGDIRGTAFGGADVVMILDVLHYIDTADQNAVLGRVLAALSGDGVLLLRVGDASAGLRFRISQWVDYIVMFARRHRLPRLHSRPLREWIESLERLGFEVEAAPMSEGTPFANVLLVARLGESGAGTARTTQSTEQCRGNTEKYDLDLS